MSNFNLSLALTVLFTVFLSGGTHNLDYSDLEALGVNCPERDSCTLIRNHRRDYMNRSCECDRHCGVYRDCCIDATKRYGGTAPKTNVRCLHYGKNDFSGVFVISKCRYDWQGPREVREKCAGHLNMSDPLSSAPATDTSRSVTYRNLYCAECNCANLTTLSTFSFGLSCYGLQNLTKEQISREITYNSQMDLWGIYTSNSDGREREFIGCDIHYEVPDYLNKSVRFCRSNLISTCAPDWKRNAVRRACADYMAVVYDNGGAYRNPHCALCNRKTLHEISCRTETLSRRRPASFAELIFNINQRDGDQIVDTRSVTTPKCPPGRKYDPFFKKCRSLVCALPGFVMVDGRCIRG